MRVIITILLLGIAGLMFWVRLAPSDASRWHVDPEAAPATEDNSYRLAPPDAPVFDAPPQEVLAAIDRVAMDTPRVTRLAGTVEAGHITYIARSALWGFPDYVTIRVMPDAASGRTTLAILSRARYGQSDMGVNRARVENWMGQVEDLLTP